MSRKLRETKKIFKVFCEGDTELCYIDEMRRQKKPTIALKPVNMKGGGYNNFLEHIRTDSNTNCLAKFIIIDGDKAISEESEKKALRELLEFCILQNQSGRTPHFLIINYPDFEYIACLHTSKYKGQDTAHYIVKEMGYKNVEEFKSDKKIYTVLNSNGNSYNLMLCSLNKEKCFIANKYTISKNKYDIKTNTIYDWEKLGYRSSNINEFFEIIEYFNT